MSLITSLQCKQIDGNVCCFIWLVTATPLQWFLCSVLIMHAGWRMILAATLRQNRHIKRVRDNYGEHDAWMKREWRDRSLTVTAVLLVAPCSVTMLIDTTMTALLRNAVTAETPWREDYTDDLGGASVNNNTVNPILSAPGCRNPLPCLHTDFYVIYLGRNKQRRLLI